MARPMEKTMTPAQVAELLEVNIRTLENWRTGFIDTETGERIRTGPAYYRLNGNGPVRYNAASVRKWMNANLIMPGEKKKSKRPRRRD